MRQVFYNAWTYNNPGHQVHGYGQDVARIFESDLKKAVGADDEWGLLEGSTIAMAGGEPVNEGRQSEEGGGGGGEGGEGGGGRGTGLVLVKAEDGAAPKEMDEVELSALVESRAGAAVAAAHSERDEAVAHLREERAAREAFEVRPAPLTSFLSTMLNCKASICHQTSVR